MNIVDLQKELNIRIKQIDERIERLSAPSFYDQSKKIENLHGEALAYKY